MTSPDPAVVALTRQLAELRQQVADMELAIEALSLADAKRHKIKDSIKWHDITDEARDLEIARLRGWERDVLVPVLGYHVLPCWPLHVPACVRMEVMFELWRTLWLSKRTEKVLAAQAEYFIRTLPGLADDIRTICKACDHLKDAKSEEVAA
jgi:hypothetical protein